MFSDRTHPTLIKLDRCSDGRLIDYQFFFLARDGSNIGNLSFHRLCSDEGLIDRLCRDGRLIDRLCIDRLCSDGRLIDYVVM